MAFCAARISTRQLRQAGQATSFAPSNTPVDVGGWLHPNGHPTVLRQSWRRQARTTRSLLKVCEVPMWPLWSSSCCLGSEGSNRLEYRESFSQCGGRLGSRDKAAALNRTRRRQLSLPHAILREPELAEIARVPDVVNASWELLRVFDRNDARGEPQPSLATEESRAALRDAVLVASRAAEINEQASPLLGICASSVADGVRALREWTAALNTTMSMPVSKEDGQADITKIDTPVYIKYNARSLFCYLTQYTGDYRGVIVQLGQQQVGHLPLSLFKEP